MKIKPLIFSSSDEHRQKVLFEQMSTDCAFNYGTVFLKKGIRIPDDGFSRHPQTEISYVVSGAVQTLNQDGSDGPIIKTGDVIHLDRLEPQAGIVLEDTKIIYVLIGG